jgi:hypothetical protein
VSFLTHYVGRVTAQAIYRQFPNAAVRVRARAKSYGICGGPINSVADFSEYFGTPCQFVFHQFLQNHHHLSSGAGTIGQTVAALPSGLSLTP